MPAKGSRTMGEELENVAMRLPVSVLPQVDAHIDTLRKTAPWAKVGRSDALRDLVVRGLQSLAQPAPPVPPQPAHLSIETQPAVPIALEGVPPSQTQPVAPTPQPARKRPTSDAAPAMVQCPVNPAHRPYAARAKECPMCANNRRTRASKQRAKAQAQPPS